MRKIISVSDLFQQNYTYALTEPIGKNFDPDFKPQLTPKQMLELGVFNGNYFEKNQKELPVGWFKKAKISDCPNKKLNYFKVSASMPLSVWQKKGWIYKDDPRGWFQWYCRYFLGRRIPPEDERQIKRWRAIRRHIAQIKKHCHPFDITCRPTQRQALLHWAYDSRKI